MASLNAFPRLSLPCHASVLVTAAPRTFPLCATRLLSATTSSSRQGCGSHRVIHLSHTRTAVAAYHIDLYSRRPPWKTRRPLCTQTNASSRPQTSPYCLRAAFSTQRRPLQHRIQEDSNEKTSARSERGSNSSDAPISQSLATARNRVRSSLTNLTPHENIYNLPNLLTVSRLFAAPAIAYLLLHDHHFWAFALFAYAGITDLVDGWMARKWNLQTVAGSVIDPGADKALMIIVTATLAVKGAIPVYLATLILGRDASLAIAAIYYRYASLPAPKTFLRYWDFSLPSAQVHPTTVSKYNTFLQLILIGTTLALPVVTNGGAYAGVLQSTAGISDGAALTALHALQLLVAGTTAWSGLSYAFLPRAVTMLGEDEKLKAKQGRRGRAIIGVTFGTVVAAAAYFAAFVDAEPEISVEEQDSKQDI